MNIRISIDTTQPMQRGHCHYDPEEYHVVFEPSSGQVPRGGVALAIGSLQIECSIETGKLNFLYPWGYLPHYRWQSAQLEWPQTTIPVGVSVLIDEPPIVGVSYAVDGADQWTVHYDARNRIIQVAAPDCPVEPTAVEFAEGVVAIIAGEAIYGLVLALDCTSNT